MKKAIANGDNIDEAKLNVAIIDLRTKKTDEAEALFNELASVDRFEFKDSLYTAMAVRELIRGRSDVALIHLQNALSFNPANELAKKILAEYYFITKLR